MAKRHTGWDGNFTHHEFKSGDNLEARLTVDVYDDGRVKVWVDEVGLFLTETERREVAELLVGPRVGLHWVAQEPS